jgi:hypothetical protein
MSDPVSDPAGRPPLRPEPPSPGQRRAVRLRWVLVLLALVVGWSVCTATMAAGSRAGWSFVLGLAVTVAAFEFGAYNVRFTARWYPGLTLAAAVGSYALTVIALGLVYALSSPRTVDGLAVGIGIFGAVALWIGTEIERTRVRSKHPDQPVRVSNR